MIEVLVAALLLGCALLPCYGLFSMSMGQNEASLNEMLYANLASELLDSLLQCGSDLLNTYCEEAAEQWVDITDTSVNVGRQFVLSTIPRNTKSLSYKIVAVNLSPPSKKGYLLRVRACWREGKKERTLLLGRFIKGVF